MASARKSTAKRITPESLAASGTEHGTQTAVFCYVRQEAPHVLPPLIAAILKTRLFSIPNGGLRHAAVANQLKMEGAKSGVSDLFLAKPSGDFCGMFLEMKKPGNRKGTTDEQDAFIDDVQGDYQTDVCDDWREAVASLLNYLTQGEPFYSSGNLPRRVYPAD